MSYARRPAAIAGECAAKASAALEPSGVWPQRDAGLPRRPRRPRGGVDGQTPAPLRVERMTRCAKARCGGGSSFSASLVKDVFDDLGMVVTLRPL